MILWIVLLVLMVLGFLVYPFVAGARLSAASLDEQKTRKKTNIRLFKEQQAQLEQQQALGEIDLDQYRRLVVDAEKLLLVNTELDPFETANSAGNGLWLLPLLLIGSLVATWSIYDDIGAAEDENVAVLLNQIASLEAQTPRMIELNQELIQAVERRVQKRPDNIYYWVILAQAAIADNDFFVASQYFGSALEMAPQDSQLLAQYAETLFLLDGSKFTQRVGIAVGKAFAANSNNQIVLGLKGIEAFANGDFQLAVTYWLGAQGQLNSDSNIFQGLQVGIDRAREFIKDDFGSHNDESQLNEVQIALQINLSLDVKVPTKPGQRVFIAAVRESGPPMPLAAKKILASQLPRTVVLTEKDAILPGQDLTTETKIRVVARLSTSGSATPQSGDWEATSASIDLDEHEGEIILVIDRQRP